MASQERKIGVIYRGKLQVNPRAEKSQFFKGIVAGWGWREGVVNLAVFACVLRATTK